MSLSISDEEKDELLDEFAEKGTIAGHQICDIDSSDLSPMALVAFLYGMDVFTDTKPSTGWQQKASIQDLIENLEPKLGSTTSISSKESYNLTNLKFLNVNPEILFIPS